MQSQFIFLNEKRPLSSPRRETHFPGIELLRLVIARNKSRAVGMFRNEDGSWLAFRNFISEK